jgi:hypothetical protein
MTDAERKLIDLLIGGQIPRARHHGEECEADVALKAVRRERFDALDPEWRHKAKDALERLSAADRAWTEWNNKLHGCLTQREFSDWYDWATGKETTP